MLAWESRWMLLLNSTLISTFQTSFAHVATWQLCFFKPTDVQLSWFIHSSKITGVGDLDSCTWPCSLFLAASASHLHLVKILSHLLWGDWDSDSMTCQPKGKRSMVFWARLKEQDHTQWFTIRALQKKMWWSFFVGPWGLIRSAWANLMPM